MLDAISVVTEVTLGKTVTMALIVHIFNSQNKPHLIGNRHSFQLMLETNY
jgi:hypothetical protein